LAIPIAQENIVLRIFTPQKVFFFTAKTFFLLLPVKCSKLAHLRYDLNKVFNAKGGTPTLFFSSAQQNELNLLKENFFFMIKQRIETSFKQFKNQIFFLKRCI